MLRAEVRPFVPYVEYLLLGVLNEKRGIGSSSSNWYELNFFVFPHSLALYLLILAMLCPCRNLEKHATCINTKRYNIAAT